MNRRKPKLIIHIGQHKTGSKALQTFLAHNVQELKKNKVYYPVERNPPHNISAYANSQYRLFSLLKKEVIASCGNLEASDCYWSEQKNFCSPFTSAHKLFEAFDKERTRNGAETLLLSAEDIFDMCTAHDLNFSMEQVKSAAKILAELAGTFDYDPLLVIYIRRQDHLLAAHYIQYIKGTSLSHLDFTSFAEAFTPRLYTMDILESWVIAFGVSQICVRLYETLALPMGIVPDFFEHVLRFPTSNNWITPPHDVESVNASPGRDFIEFIRILNHRAIQKLPNFSRAEVLEVSLLSSTGSESTRGISAWLSPSQRLKLLENHVHGNAEIAKRFMGKLDNQLFSESLPQNNEAWQEYTGLTAEKAIEIAVKVQEVVNHRKLIKRAQKFRKLALLAFYSMAGIVIFILILSRIR